MTTTESHDPDAGATSSDRHSDKATIGVPHPEADGGQAVEPVIYDCTEWSGESRRLFASLLEMAGLGSAWQGTEVTVFSTDVELVDDMVAQVLSTARSAIDPDAPSIVYEIGEWPDALQNEFAAQLTISEVAYIWNADGDIVVNESDEELVEEVIEMLPDAESFDNVDGLEVQGLLNEAFMLADRLSSKPEDSTALEQLARIATELSQVSTPFGFDQRDWETLVANVESAADADAELSHKSRAKAAKSLRSRLRNYI